MGSQLPSCELAATAANEFVRTVIKIVTIKKWQMIKKAERRAFPRSCTRTLAYLLALGKATGVVAYIIIFP